jgi:hypothetical protein
VYVLDLREAAVVFWDNLLNTVSRTKNFHYESEPFQNLTESRVLYQVRRGCLTFSDGGDIEKMSNLLDNRTEIDLMTMDIVGIRFQQSFELTDPQVLQLGVLIEKAKTHFPKITRVELVECQHTSCLAILKQGTFTSISLVASTCDSLYELAHIPNRTAELKLSLERMIFPTGFVSAGHVTDLDLFYVGFSSRPESANVTWFQNFIHRMRDTLRTLRVVSGCSSSSTVYSKALANLKDTKMPMLTKVTLVLELGDVDRIMLSQSLATWVKRGIRLEAQCNHGRLWVHHDRASETLRTVVVLTDSVPVVDPGVVQDVTILIFGPRVPVQTVSYFYASLRDVRFCNVSPSDERLHWTLVTLACTTRLEELHVHAPITAVDAEGRGDFIAHCDDQSRQSISFCVSGFPSLRRFNTNIAVDWSLVLKQWRSRRIEQGGLGHLVELGLVDLTPEILDLMLNSDYWFVSRFHVRNLPSHHLAAKFEVALSLRSAIVAWNPAYHSHRDQVPMTAIQISHTTSGEPVDPTFCSGGSAQHPRSLPMNSTYTPVLGPLRSFYLPAMSPTTITAVHRSSASPCSMGAVFEVMESRTAIMPSISTSPSKTPVRKRSSSVEDLGSDSPEAPSKRIRSDTETSTTFQIPPVPVSELFSIYRDDFVAKRLATEFIPPPSDSGVKITAMSVESTVAEVAKLLSRETSFDTAKLNDNVVMLACSAFCRGHEEIFLMDSQMSSDQGLVSPQLKRTMRKVGESVQWIVAPICTEEHWILVVASNSKEKIFVFDSLGQSRPAVVPSWEAKVVTWKTMVASAMTENSGWSTMGAWKLFPLITSRIQRRDDGHSCGVFTISFCEAVVWSISNETPLDELKPRETKLFWRDFPKKYCRRIRSVLFAPIETGPATAKMLPVETWCKILRGVCPEDLVSYCLAVCSAGQAAHSPGDVNGTHLVKLVVCKAEAATFFKNLVLEVVAMHLSRVVLNSEEECPFQALLRCAASFNRIVPEFGHLNSPSVATEPMDAALTWLGRFARLRTEHENSPDPVTIGPVISFMFPEWCAVPGYITDYKNGGWRWLFEGETQDGNLSMSAPRWLFDIRPPGDDHSMAAAVAIGSSSAARRLANGRPLSRVGRRDLSERILRKSKLFWIFQTYSEVILAGATEDSMKNQVPHVYEDMVELRAILVECARRLGDHGFQKAKSYQDATLLLKVSDHGFAGAKFALGCFYLAGVGVREDGETAYKHFNDASQLGHIGAKFVLGCSGCASMDDGELVFHAQHLKDAAEGGHSDAQFELGVWYESGRGFDKSMEQAVRWFGMAADQGHLLSRAKLTTLKSAV